MFASITQSRDNKYNTTFQDRVEETRSCLAHKPCNFFGVYLSIRRKINMQLTYVVE